MASTSQSQTHPVVVEAFVLTSMALTTIALGTALHLQMGLEMLVAVVLALAAYAFMLVAHGLFRRGSLEPETALDVEPAVLDRGRDDDMAVRVAEALKSLPEEPVQAPDEIVLTKPSSTPEPQSQPVSKPMSLSDAKPFSSAAVAHPDVAFNLGSARPRPEPALPSKGPGLDDAHISGRALAEGAALETTNTSSGGSKTLNVGGGQDAPELATTQAAAKSASPAPLSDLPPAQYAPSPERELPAPAPPRPADVEMIQGLIKKLAAEVNAAEFADPSAAQAGAAVGGSASVTSGDVNAVAQGPNGAVADPKVDALRVAAENMRALDDRAAEVDQAAGGLTRARTDHTQPDRSQADIAQADLVGPIKSAVKDGRVDVLLDPIVGLTDSRMQHFEIALRLRGQDNRVLDVDEHAGTLRGTGVYPLLDQVKLERTCQLAYKLQARGKAGSVFSQTRGESLIADLFLDKVADAYRAHEAFATRLIMTFSQSDVRAFGPREWATLTDMADLGFRFAMGSVSDLDMDFEDLANRGFEFLKLDADVFLNGLRTGESVVPASDICRHVSQLGMSVIVGRIENENDRAKIFGFGVLLGQGTLFGAPRMVRAQAVMASGQTSSSGGPSSAAVA